MSLNRETNIEARSYIDTEYSSGDSNKMKPKPCQEENNNEIDELSKDLAEMGCIVDAVKRPPNICVETCVHEDVSEAEDDTRTEKPKGNDEDGYSDEFEEDNSEAEESIEIRDELRGENSRQERIEETNHKIPKCRSSTSTIKPAQSLSGSGRSTSYGSISVPKTRRVNMSFTNDRLREIERHNHILLSKIVSARNIRKSSIPPRDDYTKRMPPSAAVHRKQQQRKIDHENMILLKKIQRAKSSACSVRR